MTCGAPPPHTDLSHMASALPAPPAPSPSFPLLLTFISIIVGALLLLFWWSDNTRFFFVSQMMLVTITICITPSIAHHLTKQWGHFTHMTLEIALFIVLLFVFSVWLLGKNALGVWIVYAIGLILLLEVGSHLVKQNKEVTLNRLSQITSYSSLQNDAKTFERMFLAEQILYIPVPFGLIVGTIFGLIRSWTPQATIIYSLLLILLFASFVLIYFLIVAFRQMSNPLLKNNEVSSAAELKDQEQRDLDLSSNITGLRKIYLYDAMHNVILLVAFAAIVVSLLGIVVNTKWLIGGLIGGSFLFNQLPYVIGQYQLHEKVLEKYEGMNRVEMREKLKKYSPQVPTSTFLGALFTTGTTGEIIYFMLNQLIKNAFI